MVDEVDIAIGKRLRRRRLQLGLTQHDIADSAGVRFQQIQKYECGQNRIAAARLWRLAQALDTPIAYFFDQLPVESEQKTIPKVAVRQCG